MKNYDTLLKQIGEKFGMDIYNLVKSNSTVSVNIISVTDTEATVALAGEAKRINVPLYSTNIPFGSIVIKPNVGSLSLISYVNGFEEAPYFVAHSQVDSITFTRGKTSFTWKITPPNKDADGNEIESETSDEITLSVGESSVKVTNDEWTFNGGQLGGLTKTLELVEQLNKVTARIDGIIDAINNPSVVAYPGDGGASLWSLFRTQIATIVDKENFENVENEKIKQ